MDIYSIGKIMQLNAEQNKIDTVRRIIQKCLCEDDKENYQNVGKIRRDLGFILRKRILEKVQFYWFVQE
ncbi:MAG: hypothetical protein ACLVI9_07060 [Anaerostipes hadrus]